MPALCGIYLNRARMISFFLFVPLSVLIIFVGSTLDYGSENHTAIKLAHSFIMLNLPGVYFMSLFDMTRGFLNCFKATWIPMLIQVTATCLHVFWCHLFINQLGWGVTGIGLAFTLTSFILLFAITIYTNCLSEMREVLFWHESLIWSGWPEYLKLALTSSIVKNASFAALDIFLVLRLSDQEFELSLVMLVVLQVS